MKIPKLSTEAFISAAKKKHGNRYDYSKVVYKNAMTKVTIISEYGAFEITPANHLRGQGCPVAGSIKANLTTTEQFISKSRKKHLEFYSYEDVRYVNSRSRVNITCPKHGSFSQTPSNHVSGAGCPECANVRNSRRLTTETFIDKAKAKYGDKAYDYSNVDYKNNKTKVIVTCPMHGDFQSTPVNHLSGRGCPECVAVKNAMEKKDVS